MPLGERIVFECEGKFLGIEKGAGNWLILSDGEEKKVYDTKLQRFVSDFIQLDGFARKSEKEFAESEEKICSKNNDVEYMIVNSKIITRVNSDKNTRNLDLEKCPFNAKKYKYKIYDLVVSDEDNIVYFVGKRSYEDYNQEGLFSFPVVDFG